MTVSDQRLAGRPDAPAPLAACAAGAAAPPASATPAPVTADLFRNFRRFNGMSRSPRERVNNARRF
ncbi:hypothetical protein GCM10010510_05390 [Streptomyces anandii JCM 4720]|nr:hypothetical protein GCM10010510_05390 [Streptomyces anandii JCM 4720]